MGAAEKNMGAAITPADGPAWAQSARDDAAARLAATGLPGRRDEYWKYTDPTSLTEPEAAQAALFKSDESPFFDGIDRLRVVFVDGVFDADASDNLTLEGVEIERLAEANADIHWAKGIFGVLEANGQIPVVRPLAALNTATAADGVLIRVTKTPSRPISLVYRHADERSDAMLHHVVRVESGASLTLLENGPAAARFNKVMEIDVADGAEFHHVRAQGRDHERRVATHMFARLGQESVFKSFTLTMNGVLTRNEVVIELTGDDAVAHVAGAAVGDGDFHHDDTVFITHDALRCESRQVFKKVLQKRRDGRFPGQDPGQDGRPENRWVPTVSGASAGRRQRSSSPSRSWRSTPMMCCAATARPPVRLTKTRCSTLRVARSADR